MNRQCILALGGSLLISANALGAIVYVKPGGTGDGSSWTTAYPNPQDG